MSECRPLTKTSSAFPFRVIARPRHLTDQLDKTPITVFKKLIFEDFIIETFAQTKLAGVNWRDDID